MSVVREMHKRLEGNGAEFENKDLAGWMHALRFVLTPRPDLVASATAAGGGSLEAFVVEHLLDLCGATVAPPEFDSAPAAAAPAAASPGRTPPPAKGSVAKLAPAAAPDVQAARIRAMIGGEGGAMYLASVLERYAKTHRQRVDFPYLGQGSFRAYMDTLDGVVLGPRLPSGGGEKVYLEGREDAPARDAARDGPKKKKKGKADLATDDAAVVAKCLEHIADLDLGPGVPFARWCSTLAGRFGSRPDVVKGLKARHGSFAAFARAHAVELGAPGPDAAPPAPAPAKSGGDAERVALVKNLASYPLIAGLPHKGWCDRLGGSLGSRYPGEMKAIRDAHGSFGAFADAHRAELGTPPNEAPKSKGKGRAEAADGDAASVALARRLIASDPGRFDGALPREQWLMRLAIKFPKAAKAAVARKYKKFGDFVDAHAAALGAPAKRANGRAAPRAAAAPPRAAAAAAPPAAAPPSRDDDLATFLAKQGLPPHVCARLQAEDVDTVATLALVTEQDLVEIGVALGPRRKLLIAIASLSGVA